jgi:hypothetical protein
LSAILFWPAARQQSVKPISLSLFTTSASNEAPLFFDFLALNDNLVCSSSHSNVIFSLPPHPGLLALILIAAQEIPVFSEASSIELKSSVCPSLNVALHAVFNYVFLAIL